MDELPAPDGLDDALASGVSPSLDDFRGVLARHRRGQWQRFAGGLAAAVIVAGGVGFLVGHDGPGSGATQLTQNGATAPASSPPAASPSPGAGEAFSNASGMAALGSAPDTQVLVRSADDGVRVRLYQQTLDKVAPAGACVPVAFVQAEVSDDQVAGVGGGMEWTQPTSGALDPLGAQVVGGGEPQPILTVVSHTGAGVATVTLSTPAGTDHATPTASGWVALAVQLPAGSANVPDGTLTATGADGKVLATTALSSISGGKTPPCAPLPPTCVSSGGTTTNVSGGEVAAGSASGSGPTGTVTSSSCVCKVASATGASGAPGSVSTCSISKGDPSQTLVPPSASGESTTTTAP